MKARLIAAIVCIFSWGVAAKGDAKQLLETISTPQAPAAPVRAITRGPKFHWFGYYDKLQFDPTGRYVLGMEVDFEGRSPRADDVIAVGRVDLKDGDKWVELGRTRAWCWQQGCMLQWRPGSPNEVMWNDREDGRFICRILNVATGKTRTLPRPIYHVSPDGRFALGADFARINHCRPGYGYAGVDDPDRDVLRPKDSGIYLLDLETGDSRTLLTIARIADIPYADPAPQDKHWFNHIQWSPDGKRFIFLHRWSNPARKGFQTRMFTASADGGDVRLVTDKPGVSHFEWRDAEHITIHRTNYYLYRDDGTGREELMWEAPNGHQSYLPDKQWLVTDTYPKGKDRLQCLYLYHLPTRRAMPLGRFAQPKEYSGEWRCDLHPRLSPDARRACIDSVHGGDGRQMYLVDIGGALDAADQAGTEAGR